MATRLFPNCFGIFCLFCFACLNVLTMLDFYVVGLVIQWIVYVSYNFLFVTLTKSDSYSIFSFRFTKWDHPNKLFQLGGEWSRGWALTAAIHCIVGCTLQVVRVMGWHPCHTTDWCTSLQSTTWASENVVQCQWVFIDSCSLLLALCAS